MQAAALMSTEIPMFNSRIVITRYPFVGSAGAGAGAGVRGGAIPGDVADAPRAGSSGDHPLGAPPAGLAPVPPHAAASDVGAGVHCVGAAGGGVH